MLKILMIASIVMMLFSGCAVEEESLTNQPTLSQTTIWIPEQR